VFYPTGHIKCNGSGHALQPDPLPTAGGCGFIFNIFQGKCWKRVYAMTIPVSKSVPCRMNYHLSPIARSAVTRLDRFGRGEMMKAPTGVNAASTTSLSRIRSCRQLQSSCHSIKHLRMQPSLRNFFG
jgi:hypothetical protein